MALLFLSLVCNWSDCLHRVGITFIGFNCIFVLLQHVWWVCVGENCSNTHLHGHPKRNITNVIDLITCMEMELGRMASIALCLSPACVFVCVEVLEHSFLRSPKKKHYQCDCRYLGRYFACRLDSILANKVIVHGTVD